MAEAEVSDANRIIDRRIGRIEAPAAGDAKTPG
jgi:hypothetical protein